jgi:hypothetical protein
MAQLLCILVVPVVITYAIERNAKVAFLKRVQPGADHAVARLHWGVYLAAALFFATCCDFVVSLIHWAGRAPVVGSIQF